MIRSTLLRGAATVMAAASVGLAATAADAQDAGSRQAREFAQAAASSDQFEILEAETVLGQSDNAGVRDFAKRMLQDHQRLIQAVRDAAQRSGMKPPEMAMSADQAQWLGALQSVKGSALDKMYLEQQVLAHHSALAVEQIYAQSGDDAALKQLAASSLPLMSEHGDMARQLQARLAGK